MAVQVEVWFDGANPQEATAVECLAADHYRVYPYSEDGDANYKFALAVRLDNPSPAPEPLVLDVDWGTLEYMDARHFVHLGAGHEWARLEVTTSGSVNTAALQAPPGVSYVGLSPAYNLGDYRACRERMSRRHHESLLVGLSEQGRIIEAFRFGAGPRRVLVLARVHPYETASSFCVEGLLDALARPDAALAALLAEATVTVVAMPNPDGVILGLCKRTAVGGVDLSHEGGRGGDATARSLLALADGLRPEALLDIHGWMYDEEDGLHYEDEALGQRFRAQVEAQPLFAGNRWKATLEPPAASDGSFRRYCAAHFGTQTLAVSYRWPGRSCARMAALGRPTLMAFWAAL